MAIVPNRYLHPTGGSIMHPGGGGLPGLLGGHRGNPLLSIYNNRGLFGSGGKASLQDLLGGISQQQLTRMQHGYNPGGFNGDFVGMSPARLKMLAQMMVANQQAGPVGQDGNMGGPTMYSLQHRPGDGLFAGRKMLPQRGLGIVPPRQQPHGFAGGAARGGGMRHALMQMAMNRLGGIGG